MGGSFIDNIGKAALDGKDPSLFGHLDRFV
jgi:hypothetical protein